jgi:outer membrane cobalamin receptor
MAGCDLCDILIQTSYCWQNYGLLCTFILSEFYAAACPVKHADTLIMKRLAIIFCLVPLLSSFSLAQQKAFVSGRITEKASGQHLVGATVVLDSTNGVISGADGTFLFITTPGKHILDFIYMGYKSQRFTLDLTPADTTFLNVSMESQIQMLDEVVVSAGKYEQKISDVIVSMDIIKAGRIETTVTNTLETVINQTPGIDVLDGQPRIRGGSGYSYGAGSRVLVLVDDLPILSPDAGDVKWDYLPVENISQVEVIKGASSVLYGSSALNGIINVRTAYATSTPTTKISLMNGLYMDPARKELIWWDKRPSFSGASVFHSRKAGNLDIVCSYNGYDDAGYRENEWERRNRINLNLLYRPKKIPGLSYGVNSNAMFVKKCDFFLWQNADSGAYRQNESSVSKLGGIRLNVDPFFEYYNNKGSRHSLKTRYFRITNIYKDVPDKDNEASLYYGEYKYHKTFKMPVDLTVGTSASYANINSRLYENHTSLNASAYAQADAEIRKMLKISLGLRFEAYRLDDYTEFAKPIFRAGLNYHLSKYTFIRASFGQGYRFPSIAEKYTATSLSSLHIFPNPDLNSEYGWSTELGIKQGLRIKNMNGFLDFSLFQSRYKDMIEFTFGVYKPDSVAIPTLDHVGFKALNIGNARITGAEITLGGEGTVFNLPVTLQAGYTYLYPVDLDYDSSETGGSATDKILKYRYQHSAKIDLQLEWKRLSTGFCLIYNSYMKNIDAVFTDPVMGNLILPGYPEYREKHQKGMLVYDHRIAYRLTDHAKISVLVKNLFNAEYMGRPGDIGPPRNITCQLSVDF